MTGDHRAHFAALADAAKAAVLAGARDTQTDAQIARHEAGHAVAALVAGARFEYVQITALGALAGRRLNPGGIDGYLTSYQAPPLAIAVISWAGPLAENSLFGAEGDLLNIRGLQRRFGYPYLTGRDRDSAYGLARDLLAENTAAVDAVAAELLARLRLDYADVERICRRQTVR